MPPQASLALAMVWVAAVWAASLLGLFGLGSLCLRILGGRDALRVDGLTTCAFGFVAAIGFLQAWHLFRPVNGVALAAVSLLGAAGVALATWAGRRPAGTATSGEMLFLAFAAAWAANRATGACESYDSANYHLTIVRWYHEHAVVPGLANLYPLAGINLPTLLWSALFETGAGAGAGAGSHFANGVIVMLGFAFVALRVGPVLRGRAAVTPSRVASLVLAYPLVNIFNRPHWLSSPATDTAPLVVTVLAVVLVLESFEPGPGDETASQWHLVVGLSLLSLLGCLKPTVGAFALLGWLAAGAALLPHLGKRARKPVLAAALVSLGLGITWMVRNAILSGFPLYPMTVLRVNADWTVPAVYADGIRWVTKTYSRTPDAFDRLPLNEHGWDWLTYWKKVELRSSLNEILIPVALVFAALATATFLAARGGRPPKSGRGAGALFVAAAFSGVIWFLTAPLARYGEPVFWAAAAASCGLAAAFTRPRTLEPRYRVVAWLFVALPLLQSNYYRFRALPPKPLATLQQAYWTPPGDDGGFHALRVPALDAVEICGGAEALTPRRPAFDRSHPPWQEGVIWSASLPATPRVDPNLCLRTAGNLDAGFRTLPSAESWSAIHSSEVLAARDASGWSIGRLSMYFWVRPEHIEEALAIAARGVPQATNGKPRH